MHPIREKTIKLVQATMRHLDEVQRLHPEQITPAMFAELRGQFVAVMHDVQDLLIEMGPAIDQMCERHEKTEREAWLYHWFSEAFDDTVPPEKRCHEHRDS